MGRIWKLKQTFLIAIISTTLWSISAIVQFNRKEGFLWFEDVFSMLPVWLIGILIGSIGLAYLSRLISSRLTVRLAIVVAFSLLLSFKIFPGLL